jgi:hypothetical protein
MQLMRDSLQGLQYMDDSSAVINIFLELCITLPFQDELAELLLCMQAYPHISVRSNLYRSLLSNCKKDKSRAEALMKYLLLNDVIYQLVMFGLNDNEVSSLCS